MTAVKILGICANIRNGVDFAEIAASGVQWVRIGTGFPWADKLYGTLSDSYLRCKEAMCKAKASGLNVMGITPLIGGRSWSEERQKSIWKDAWPKEIVGYRYVDPEFYDIVEEVCAWIARDLEGLVDDVWQIANEMDAPTFRGPYGLETAKKLAWAEARGIRREKPDALCGINPAYMTETSRILFRACYAEGTPLNYAGIDGYYGSWSAGTVEKWQETIDEIHEITGMNVLVNEWGYSSIGAVAPKPVRFAEKNGLGSVCATKTWHYAWKGETVHTEELQAAYLKRGLEILYTHPHCLGGFIYCWSDDPTCGRCGQPDCPAECAWGIVRCDKTPKPAYWVVREASQKFKDA